MPTRDQWRALASGSRDAVVTIQSRAVTVGPTRSPIETWTSMATMWASKEPSQGNEVFAPDQTVARQADVYTVHYRPDMDPDRVNVPADRRLIMDGRLYEIIAAELMDRQRGIRLTTISGGVLEP